MRRINTKKGSIQDLVIGASFFVIIIIGAIFGVFIYNNIMDGLLASEKFDAPTQAIVQQGRDNFGTTIDYAIALWFSLLVIVSVVLAYYLDNSPIFVVIFIVLMIISLLSLAALGVLFSPIMDSTELASTMAAMPITNFIGNFWLLLMIAWGLSLGLALYVKRSQQ